MRKWNLILSATGRCALQPRESFGLDDWSSNDWNQFTQNYAKAFLDLDIFGICCRIMAHRRGHYVLILFFNVATLSPSMAVARYARPGDWLRRGILAVPQLIEGG